MEADEKVEAVYTVNQIVAYNLAAARKSKGWTQTEAASQLAPFLGITWSKATLSAAERSFSNPERIRQFTADDIIAFASAFELPIQYFFIPPAPREDEELTLCSGEATPGKPLSLGAYLGIAFGFEEGIKAAERRLATVLKAIPDADAESARESLQTSMRNLTRAKATNDQLRSWRDALFGMLAIIDHTLIEHDVGKIFRDMTDALSPLPPLDNHSKDSESSSGGDESG